MQVAKILKAHRERCQLSFEALSENVAITVSRLKKFESAQTSPYFPDEFFRLAYAFGIRPETLVRQMLLQIAPKKTVKAAQR